MALTEHIPQESHALKRASYEWWWDRPHRPQPIEKRPGSYSRPVVGAVTMHAIAEHICFRHGVTMADLKTPFGPHHKVVARQEFMALAYDLPHTSYPIIAAFLHLKDHTTVMWGVKAHKRRQTA